MKSFFVIAVVLVAYVACGVKAWGPFGGGKNPAPANWCVEEHNEFRRQHGVDDLEFDQTLSDFAYKQVTKLAKKDEDVLKHLEPNNYGENLYRSSGGPEVPDCKKAVQMWYDEKANYNEPRWSMNTGHFTQVIWKDSKRVGCASKQAKSKRVYVACEYDPAGNINTKEYYEANVLNV